MPSSSSHRCMYRLACLALFIVAMSATAAAQTHPFGLADLSAPDKHTAGLWVDLNEDGWLDLMLLDSNLQNDLLLGSGDGFGQVELQLSQHALTDGVFVDFDNDGDQDLVAGGLNRGSLILNDGGVLRNTSSPLSGYRDTRHLNVVDVDLDGRLDVFLGRRFGASNALLIQDEGGALRVAPGDHRRGKEDTTSACWGDFDGDGDLDVYVTNGGDQPNQAYRNNAGRLVREDFGLATTERVSTAGCAWGDADGDGDLDLAVTNVRGAPSRLFLNEGGAFSEAPAAYFDPPETDAFGVAWGDIDNDGDLDLVLSARYAAALVLINAGERFEVAELDAVRTREIWATSAALADYDQDGDLDLALATGVTNSFEASPIYENRLAVDRRWLQVTLEGEQSNRDGIGARIEAHARIGGVPRVLVRERTAHSGRHAQAGPWIHVGLGDASIVDSLVVRWPSGIRQTLFDVAADQFMTVREPSRPVSVEPSPVRPLEMSVSPNPTQNVVAVTLEGASGEELVVEAFDTRGRLVWRQVLVEQIGARRTLRWDVAGVAPGTYVLRASARAGKAVARVQIVR